MSDQLAAALQTLGEARRRVAEEMAAEFPIGIVVSFKFGRGVSTGVVTYHPSTWTFRPDRVAVRHASGRIHWVTPLQMPELP